MATPNTPMLIPKKAQAGIVEYVKNCNTLLGSNWNIREQLRNIDLKYMREADLSTEHKRAEAANKYGDTSKFQNIQVPVVLPAVEAAVTYQASVFLTGNPIFGVVSNPQNMDAALQMETIIEDQQIRGAWIREFTLFFRDGFKYNLAGLEVSWGRKVSAALETDLSFSTSQARPVETIWEGNTIKRLDPYNMIFDHRVLPALHHMYGEFGGYIELMSRIQLKKFIAELPYKMTDNITTAFEAPFDHTNFHVPELNPNALKEPGSKYGEFNWLAWANIAGAESKIRYQNMYAVTTLYARILPSDFNLSVPGRNTPQIWKFILVNNSVLLYAERQTNAHDYLPILLSQPLEDGLGYQTKSLANNVAPIQDITTAMWNSIIAARRRAVSDRGIYDPSRISEAHINSDNPAAKIPVRPTAYGKPVQDAYYPIPFRDEQSGVFLQESEQLYRMADKITGNNPVRQGQFVKGNKTRREFDTVMGNANGRDQVISMLLEAQVMTPVKEIIKMNILQYQGGVSLYNRNLEQAIQIDPVELRKAVMEFKVSDGLIPSSKLMDTDTSLQAMQLVSSSPQLASEYNIGPMFSYLMKLQGAKISEFEKSPAQKAYESAVQQWQMAAQSAIQAGQEFNIPQPKPQDYGYNPAQQGASPVATQPAEVATRVNNITNNITNAEQQ